MLPNYDILALDIDGTLLRSDKSLAGKDAEAVRRAVRAGVRVVLATARPPRSTRPILEALGLLDPSLAGALRARMASPDTGAGAITINYNGALLWEHAPSVGPGLDPGPVPEGSSAAFRPTRARGRHIEHLPLDAALARRAVEHARRLEPRVIVWVEILDRWFTDRLGHDFEGHETEGTILGTETSKTHGPDEIADLAGVLRVPPTKVMFLAPPTRLAHVLEGMNAKFGRKGLLACKVSDSHLFSVCHTDADKGPALKRFAHAMNVPRERVLAIGDAPNDAQMLRWAGRGLAVANAWDEARSAADAVLTKSNDECAVAEAIESELLGGKSGT